MISIRAALLTAAAITLAGATAASAQAADRGQHNSDGSYGLHSYAHIIGDTAIEDGSSNGGILTASAAKANAKVLAVAEVRSRTSAR